jgi:hypothetical protein
VLLAAGLGVYSESTVLAEVRMFRPGREKGFTCGSLAGWPATRAFAARPRTGRRAWSWKSLTTAIHIPATGQITTSNRAKAVDTVTVWLA